MPLNNVNRKSARNIVKYKPPVHVQRTPKTNALDFVYIQQMQ
jgi:hypothetical protein